jgi:hypothetical protein
MNPWEVNWVEFELPDGYTAAYAIDGKDVQMMVDDDQIPDGLTVRQRLEQCYDHFFREIYPTLTL